MAEKSEIYGRWREKMEKRREKRREWEEKRGKKYH